MIKNPPIIKKVVQEMGGKIEEIIPERGIFLIKIKNKEILVVRKFNISNNFAIGSEVTKFKDLTDWILRRNDINTPKTICFYRKNFDKRKCEEQIKEIKFPIIVKDAQGSQSKGVFPNVKTLKDAIKLIKKEIKNFSKIIVQEMVSGKEYRVLILGGKVIGAMELIPPRIMGNGEDSVRELIINKQKETEKKTAIDRNLKEILKEQGVSLRTVLEKGKIVYIRKNSCLAEGGETKDVTESVSKDIENICAKAADAVQRCLVGIDVMCEDITKDLKNQEFNIIEINGRPDIYIHYKPDHGEAQNVVKKIINFILNLQ